MAVFFASWMAYTLPGFAGNISLAVADHHSLSKSKNLTVEIWLPDLTGLPDKDQVDLLTKHLLTLMSEEKDRKCSQIDVHLRRMVFQHFLIYQHMANKQNIYFDEQIAHKWAQVLAMILRESSGDSTSITDMGGHSVSTYSAHTNLQHWKNLFSSAVRDRIKFNYQTNFGLTQLSADRLYVALHLAKNPGLNTGFLKGEKGALTLRKEDLNTAIAIRRLIWFYQDLAQGRISQSDKRIYREDITKPELSKKHRAGLKMALLYCGTHSLFHVKDNPDEKKEFTDLENTMASIAYCKLGNPQRGYGRDEFDEKCFAEWVTLCPALNIDIALITPLKYFETRKAPPVCKDMFKRMINKKPDIK